MTGLAYKQHTPRVLIGTKVGTTRTPVALTTSYADNTKTFSTGGFSKLNLSILYTMGAAESSNSIDIQIEESPDGTNFYRVPNESASSGTSTIFAREIVYVGVNAAAAPISFSMDIFYPWMKVSFKESGVASNAGSVFCEATLSGF